MGGLLSSDSKSKKKNRSTGRESPTVRISRLGAGNTSQEPSNQGFDHNQRLFGVQKPPTRTVEECLAAMRVTNVSRSVSTSNYNFGAQEANLADNRKYRVSLHETSHPVHCCQNRSSSGIQNSPTSTARDCFVTTNNRNLGLNSNRQLLGFQPSSTRTAEYRPDATNTHNSFSSFSNSNFSSNKTELANDRMCFGLSGETSNRNFDNNRRFSGYQNTLTRTTEHRSEATTNPNSFHNFSSSNFSSNITLNEHLSSNQGMNSNQHFSDSQNSFTRTNSTGNRNYVSSFSNSNICANETSLSEIKTYPGSPIGYDNNHHFSYFSQNSSTRTTENVITRSNSSSSFSSSECDANKTLLTEIVISNNSPKTNLKSVDLSTAMNLDQPTGQFVTTYVAAIYSNEKAILMTPAEDDIEGVTIRITKDTEIGDSEYSINFSTLFITQEVKVYGVVATMEEDAKLPTWTSSRWIATKIMPCEPIPPTTKTIGFAYEELLGGRFPIISDETPAGFILNRSNFLVDDKKGPQLPLLGTMYMINSYELRRGTAVAKMPDVTLYIPNKMKTTYEENITDIFSSKIKALTQLIPASPFEMKMCRTKCRSKKNPTNSDYELFVGKGSASMAAFESYMRNYGKDRYIVKTPSRIFKNSRSVFTAKFSFPCRDFDEEVSEVWATGASTMAVFPGDTPYSTPVEISSFTRKDNKGFATVEFPKSANDFLTSWNTIPNMETVVYGPVDDSDDFAYQAIRKNFCNFYDSSLFQQYVAAMKPERSDKKLSDEQKEMKGLSLDKFQSEALETILYSNGISLTQAPPGSGKTALVAAVTREFLKSKEAQTTVITGTTNISVDNALSTLAGIADESLDLRALRIASQRALCQSVDLVKEWSRSEKAMSFEDYISKEEDLVVLTKLRRRALGLKEEAKRETESIKIMVEKYVEAKNAVAKLEETFTEMFEPNVVATTTSLLLRNSEKSYLRSTTHILIDEASQLVPTEFLAILASFPNLEKIAIIGDEYQLEPYSQLPKDSQARNCFGTPDLVRLNREFGEAATKLKRIYRSHPQMTLNLINAFYPYQLEAGAKAENRDMAQRLDLPICADGTPVRAYHVDGKEIKGANQEEATAIVEFVKQLTDKGAKQEDILVLTFHRNQRSLLCTKLPYEVRVKTVDSAQGQQSAITIIATTKTSQSDQQRSVIRALQFIANKNRGTVALSRGLEATYIFGNLPQLEMTKFWDPIIKSIRSRNGTSNEPLKNVSTGNSSASNKPAKCGKSRAAHSKSMPKNKKKKSNNAQPKKNGNQFVKTSTQLSNISSNQVQL